MNGPDFEKGVVFRYIDYAGFWLRLLLIAIDLLVAAISWIVLFTIVIFTIAKSQLYYIQIAVLLLGIIWFVYFVLLKYLGSHTVGYLLCGVRIVNIKGYPPSFCSIAIRSILGLLGPFDFILGFVWLPDDPQRQTLRDKFTRIYVVKKRAKPIAESRIRYIAYTILGLNLVVPEVEPLSENTNH